MKLNVLEKLIIFHLSQDVSSFLRKQKFIGGSTACLAAWPFPEQGKFRTQFWCITPRRWVIGSRLFEEFLETSGTDYP
jgi:hypothetical protein